MYSLNKILSVSLCFFCLSACNSGSDIEIEDNSLTMTLPEDIRQIARLGTQALAVQVTVNGAQPRRQPLNPDDVPEEIQILANVPADQSNNIRVEWLAFPNGTEVLLADFVTDTQPNQETLTVALYNNTGDRFDQDSDGITNLQEIRENRNALGVFDLEVPFQPGFITANTDLIEGRRDSNVSGDTTDPDANSSFSLRHDGENIHLYLCGQDQVLRGDGTADNPDAFWHDDAIFLYLDGANSDNSTYDNVDDLQVVFVRSTQEKIVTPGRGGNNQFCPAGSCIADYTFVDPSNTSACVYELFVTLPIDELNMTIGEPIGFDLEITDDDNGGLRDGSNGFVGFDDQSDEDPSTFGTIRLRP